MFLISHTSSSTVLMVIPTALRQCPEAACREARLPRPRQGHGKRYVLPPPTMHTFFFLKPLANTCNYTQALPRRPSPTASRRSKKKRKPTTAIIPTPSTRSPPSLPPRAASVAAKPKPKPRAPPSTTRRRTLSSRTSPVSRASPDSTDMKGLTG
jgi:hypothetical protein